MSRGTHGAPSLEAQWPLRHSLASRFPGTFVGTTEPASPPLSTTSPTTAAATMPVVPTVAGLAAPGEAALCLEEVAPPASGTRKARVLYDYEAADSSELALLADEVGKSRHCQTGAGLSVCRGRRRWIPEADSPAQHGDCLPLGSGHLVVEMAAVFPPGVSVAHGPLHSSSPSTACLAWTRTGSLAREATRRGRCLSPTWNCSAKQAKALPLSCVGDRFPRGGTSPIPLYPVLQWSGCLTGRRPQPFHQSCF